MWLGKKSSKPSCVEGFTVSYFDAGMAKRVSHQNHDKTKKRDRDYAEKQVRDVLKYVVKESEDGFFSLLYSGNLAALTKDILTNDLGYRLTQVDVGDWVDKYKVSWGEKHADS